MLIWSRQRCRALVRDLVQNNPGDPQLLNLAWLVYLNAKDFNDAVATGTEMVRVDTAAATADYYSRLAGAYSALNQPQKASEAAARGAAKFPNDANLALFRAQNAFSRKDSSSKALDAAKKASLRIQRTPTDISCWRPSGRSQSVRRPDQHAQPGKSKTVLIRQVCRSSRCSREQRVQSGSGLEGTAQISSAPSGSCSSPTSSRSSVDAKFLLGASAFSLGQSATIDATRRSSCDLARTARDAFNLAQMNLPAGGQKYPNEAAQAPDGHSAIHAGGRQRGEALL